MALGVFDEALLAGSSTSLDMIKKWLSGNIGIHSLPAKPRLTDLDRLAVDNDDTTSGVSLQITSDTTTGGPVVDISVAALTTATALDISNLDAITTGRGIYIDATGVTHTTGILFEVDSASTALTGAGRLFLVDSTGDFNDALGIVAEIKTVHTTGTGLQLTMDSMTDGIGVFGTFDGLTIGEAFSLTHTTSVIADGGSLMRLSSTGIDTGGATNGTILDISSTAQVAGVPVLITASGITTGTAVSVIAVAVTTGAALSVTSATTALTAAGNIVYIQASGDFNDAGGQVVEIESAHTTGTGLQLTMDAVTDGFGLDITADALTSGAALRIVSSSTGLTTDGRVAHFLASGDFDDAGGVVVEIEGVQTTGVGLLLTMNSVTDGLAIQVGANGLTTGQAALISSSSTAITGTGRLLLLNHTGATTVTGIIAEIRSAATDETALMRLQAGGTGIDLEIINTNTGALGPEIQTYHNVGNSAAADDDVVFRLRVDADDEESSATKRQLMALDVQWSDATAASFASDVEWYLATGAATNLCVTLSGAGQLSVDADGGGADDPVLLFDEYDDALELQQMSLDRTKWYERMVEMGIMVRKDTGCGYMLAIQKFVYLLAGGIYQTRQRLDDKVRELEAKIAKLELAA